MTFESALTIMRAGGHVYRAAWLGNRSQWQHAGNEGTPALTILPAVPGHEKYVETIVLRNEAGEAYIWGPSQASVLADDWEAIEKPEGA